MINLAARLRDEILILTLMALSVAVPARAAEPVPTYSTGRSGFDVLDLHSRLHGVARPAISAELRPLVPGIVAEVNVREGQAVKAGDILVALDDRLEQARRRVAEFDASRTADLQRATTQLRLAEQQLERLRSAYQRNAISEFELEEQSGLVEQARAARDAQLEAKQLAAERLRLAEEELRRLRIHAPFDGVVTQIHQKIGTSVDPTVPVVSLANLDDLEIEVFAPVSYFGSLQAGKNIELRAGQPIDLQLTARVLSVSPIIDAASGTFRCVLLVDNRTTRYPAGFSVVLQPELKPVSRSEPRR